MPEEESKQNNPSEDKVEKGKATSDDTQKTEEKNSEKVVENAETVEKQKNSEINELEETEDSVKEPEKAEIVEKAEKPGKPVKRERKTAVRDEGSPKPRNERFSERRKTVQPRVDRRPAIRQGIRREEYRTRSYDALPARDFNISEIIETGNVDLIIRTAEDYAKTWSDRPPWMKNKFSTFQIRPIYSKVLKLKKSEFTEETSGELKLLKPLVAFIARRYHDDDLYEFARIIRFSIDQVGNDAKKFTNFCKFFDSLLLYFRANGGK